MAALQASTSDESTVAIQLFTNSTQHPAIPSNRYFVPASWKRYQLSELVNKVLGYQDTPVPFDFLLFQGKELLRSSLADTLKSHGLSQEATIQMEYIESVLPPTFQASIPYEDWISDVDISSQQTRYLTSSYDGTFSVFDTTTSSKSTFAPHSQSVLSTCWLPSTSEAAGSELIATAAMDSTIKISSLSKTKYELKGHQGPVASIRARGDKLISAGWDGTVAFWSLDSFQVLDSALAERVVDLDNNKSKKKKRKLMTDPSITSIKPIHKLEGHVGTVSRALIDKMDPSRAYSVGCDHSLREWSLEHGIEVSCRKSDKVLLDLTQMASPHLLATGAMDRSVCFWDLRQETEAISLTLTGHGSAVSSVSAHPTSALLILSASYDGQLRIWDARSPKQALFIIPRQMTNNESLSETTRALRGAEKVLCCDWNGSLVASGGEDKTLQLHKTVV